MIIDGICLAAAMSNDNETITRTNPTVDEYDIMTATDNDEDLDGLSEELEAEVMRLMGGQDTVLEAKLKAISGKVIQFFIFPKTSLRYQRYLIEI